MGKTEKIKQQQPQFFHMCLKFYESTTGPINKCPAKNHSYLLCDDDHVCNEGVSFTRLYLRAGR